MFDFLEVAHRFLDAGKIRKGVGEALHHALEFDDLVFIDDADQHGLVLMREAADGRDLRHTVLQALHESVGLLVRLVGDDLKLDRFLEALEHRIANAAGGEAVDKAQNNRLNLEVVDHIGDPRNNGVDAENDPHEVVFRIFVMDQCGNQIGTAGAAAQAHHAAIAETANHARRHRCEDFARSVGGHIDIRLQRQPVHQQQNNRKHRREHRRADGIFSTDDEKSQKQQRDIHNDIHISNLELKQILNNCRNTGDARRRKLVWKNKKMITDTK